LTNTEPDYVNKLTSLTEIDLVLEQQENFCEFLFFLISCESLKKENPDVTKLDVETQESIDSMRQKIRDVKKEIKRRDLAVQVLGRHPPKALETFREAE
jgi:hypothetical protein